MGQVPYATVYLGTYGSLRDRLPKKGWYTAFAGGAASLATCTLLQPLDTVRTVIQASVTSSPARRIGSWTEEVQKIVRERGVLGLWAGWRPSAVRALPTSAASMLAYESV